MRGPVYRALVIGVVLMIAGASQMNYKIATAALHGTLTWKNKDGSPNAMSCIAAGAILSIIVAVFVWFEPQKRRRQVKEEWLSRRSQARMPERFLPLPGDPPLASGAAPAIETAGPVPVVKPVVAPPSTAITKNLPRAGSVPSDRDDLKPASGRDQSSTPRRDSRSPARRSVPVGDVAMWLRVDGIVKLFEEAWHRKERNPIEAYLTGEGSERVALLNELVHVELELRLRDGEDVRVEDYLVRFPELGKDSACLLSLVESDCKLRRQRGETPQLQELADRFPAYADALQALLSKAASDEAPALGMALPVPAAEPGVVPPPTAMTKILARPDAAPNDQDVPALPEPNLDLSNEPGTRVLDREAPAALAVPEQLGRYRILRVLSDTGRTTVYLAHDEELNREVALKVPQFTAADGSAAVERFVRAARAAASLVHPNLCPVYDAGEIQGIPYLTMPHVAGRSLQTVLAEGPLLPAHEAVALVHTLALALQAAHQRGIVHRDLNPTNILLTEAGAPVVMDFGLALPLGAARLTQTGEVLGSPGYLAPEQLSGMPEAQGLGCDIYSLGVILYELLTGALPFGRTLNEVLLQVMTREVVPPSSRRPGVPASLDAVCAKALARKVEDRYRRMDEFSVALERVMASNELPVGLPRLAPSPAAISAIVAGADRTGTTRKENQVVPLIAVTVPDGGVRWRARGAQARRRRRGQPLILWLLFLVALGAVLAFVARGWLFSSVPEKTRVEIAQRPLTPVPMPAITKKVMAPPVRQKTTAGIAAGPAAPISAPVNRDANEAEAGKHFTNSLGMKLAYIPPGTFLMGSPAREPNRNFDEVQHEVVITKAFYLGVHEVTVGQFKAFVKATAHQTQAEISGNGQRRFGNRFFKADPQTNWRNPAFEQTDDHPVVRVSWNDAKAFCDWLSQKEGRPYALPTEAQWEYACRAGSRTTFSFGDDEKELGLYAWYNLNSDMKTHPVGQKRPNAWGLYDMEGNVYEWTADWYDNNYYNTGPKKDPPGPGIGTYRVQRGGGWNDGWLQCRDSFREGRGHPVSSWTSVGFRVALLRPAQVPGGTATKIVAAPVPPKTTAGIAGGPSAPIAPPVPATTAKVAPMPPALAPDLILTTSNSTGRRQIVMLELKGAEANIIKTLTNDASDQTDPAWSPDGKQIAFVSNRDGFLNIYRMDADGTHVQQLTQHRTQCLCPAWSPNGRQIAYTCRLTFNHWVIFVMNADGTDPVNLTLAQARNADPAWSPSGKQIVFCSRTGYGYQLHVMDGKGGNVRRLTPPANQLGYVYPCWSPDGQRIAYGARVGAGVELCICNADGTEPRQVTRLGRYNSRASWSPNGKYILFRNASAGESVDGTLYIMESDGRDLREIRVPRLGSDWGPPQWKPR